MPTYNTKWFQNSMAGAPVLTGQAGALIAVLNACLVDGFNLLTLDSLVVAGNVATGTKASHGYQLHQIIEIAGATPAGLNGQWRVTSVTTNTFTFTTAGISDQTATGTITAKTPGCGWEKAFTGTNVVVYRSTSAQACGNHAVRVTDTGTTTATCLAAEDFTDVNTAVNVIRTFYLPKSATADATARGWNIIADDRTVYPAISFTGGRRDVFTWGDFSSFLAGDGHAFQVRAPFSASVSNLGHQASLGYSGLWCNSLDQFATAARSYSQVLGPTPLRQMSMCAAMYNGSLDYPLAYFYNNFTGVSAREFKLSANHGYFNASSTIVNSPGYGIQGPSPIDGGLHFVPVFQMEGETALNYRIRGKSRGLLHIMETRPLTADVQLLTGVEGVADGLVMGFRMNNAVYSGLDSTFAYAETHIAIDLGNWD
jgi:hypothetical protein